MWKASLNRSIKELRFVLKQSPEHHGVWRFVKTQLPELRMLNQNTFFTVSEINANFKTDSACHIIYGDGACVCPTDTSRIGSSVFLTYFSSHVRTHPSSLSKQSRTPPRR
jgi:hypothetical protein